MKQTRINRIVASVLVALMLLTLLPATAFVAWGAGNTYVLDVSNDMEPFAPGAYANGASGKFGTDGYFILHYGAKMKLDASNKNFSDGVTATHRIKFQSTTDTTDWSYSLEFTCASAATVKIWWVAGGDARRQTPFCRFNETQDFGIRHAQSHRAGRISVETVGEDADIGLHEIARHSQPQPRDNAG